MLALIQEYGHSSDQASESIAPDSLRSLFDRTLMALGGWKSPAMLSRYAHLSPTHLYHAVEDLTRIGTVTKTVTKDVTKEGEAHKLLENVVSRLGLEPRTLALKGR